MEHQRQKRLKLKTVEEIWSCVFQTAQPFKPWTSPCPSKNTTKLSWESAASLVSTSARCTVRRNWWTRVPENSSRYSGQARCVDSEYEVRFFRIALRLFANPQKGAILQNLRVMHLSWKVRWEGFSKGGKLRITCGLKEQGLPRQYF